MAKVIRKKPIFIPVRNTNILIPFPPIDAALSVFERLNMLIEFDKKLG